MDVSNAIDIRYIAERKFLARVEKFHHYKYDYSKMIYVNIKTKICIVCPIHGEFFQTPASHKISGCQICGRTLKVEKLRLGKIEFIRRANIKHKFKYNYSKFDYINAKTKGIIICPIHGEFKQCSEHHLEGNQCPTCSGLKQKTTKEFIILSNKVHNNYYNYDKTTYINDKTKVCITCLKHGDFFQRPAHHKNGSNCPSCVSTISKAEIAWLNHLKVDLSFRHKTLRINGKLFQFDAADFENKIIWEFYGDYWHGNPFIFKSEDVNPSVNISFGELFNKTIIKEKILKENGFTLITIWESEWKNFGEING